jgi:hypothetical protein
VSRQARAILFAVVVGLIAAMSTGQVVAQTNHITNGNFSNGLANWASYGIGASVISDELQLIHSGASNEFYQAVTPGFSAGDVIESTLQIRKTDNGNGDFRYRLLQLNSPTESAVCDFALSQGASMQTLRARHKLLRAWETSNTFISLTIKTTYSSGTYRIDNITWTVNNAVSLTPGQTTCEIVSSPPLTGGPTATRPFANMLPTPSPFPTPNLTAVPPVSIGDKAKPIADTAINVYRWINVGGLFDWGLSVIMGLAAFALLWQIRGSLMDEGDD